ncbi:MAG: hypothetical protein BM557_01265 [Flavobacterium sp. MedPE-SWcel]|uniref:hypothetical protein n=1 Tax=uncultured Flavobacterium sp. TaxID=165435 RepID=UPI00091381A0|nr:hypothetical protein [uncultured Flavobacterium sp.]OIQ22036.1 MAG: hypothetical protein BM557_01265 [Flavobacterium sp. MedPE-SWcel]
MNRNEVIEFFQNLPKSEIDQFNKALELYRKNPKHNQGLMRRYNASGYTKSALQNLLYDLKQLYAIKDVEIRSKKTVNVPTSTPSATTATDINDIDVVHDDVTDDKQEVKFRDQYSFLQEEDCPNELKVLAADKITAYNNYKLAHEELQKAESGTIEISEEEKAVLAKNVTTYFEENEEIKAELVYYQENKKILGKHSIFAKLKFERIVENMSADDCFKFVKNTPSYISKKKTKIKDAVSEDKKKQFQNDIDNRNLMLSIVNKKLGLGGK